MKYPAQFTGSLEHLKTAEKAATPMTPIIKTTIMIIMTRRMKMGGMVILHPSQNAVAMAVPTNGAVPPACDNMFRLFPNNQ